MYNFRNCAVLISTFFLATSVSTVFAAGIDLNKDMSVKEFEAAGLKKLSQDELVELERWLNSRALSQPQPQAKRQPSAVAEPAAEMTVDKTRTPTPVASRVAEQPQQAQPEQRFGSEQLREEPEDDVPESIATRIVGEFRGWNGSSVFRLENGQVWRQRVGGKYRSPSRTNPEVVVERGRFGYYLKILESGRSVAVKRIR